MKIGSCEIGARCQPFVIAEMSGNHNRSLDRALAIVDAAAETGAHALKIQTYTADTLTLDCNHGEFMISDSSPWAGRSLHDLYAEAYTPWEWHAPIFKRAKERGLVAFSTPFDASAVDFLEEMDVPCYKIASFENNDLPLLTKVAATGKPLIVSTGMASLAELDALVATVRAAGCRDLVLLKCTSTYPATPENSNVRTIPHLREMFGCEVGLSDHTLGLGVATAAVALGATVIEKHFTLRRSEGGVDAAFSAEPAEMRALVVETERAWQALGIVKYGSTEAEVKSAVFRRSLYVTKDLCAGEIISADNVRSIRPGHGLAPGMLSVVVGMRVCRDVKRGAPVTWELFRP